MITKYNKVRARKTGSNQMWARLGHAWLI